MGLQDTIHGAMVDMTRTGCFDHLLWRPQGNSVATKGSTLRQPLDNHVVIAVENLEDSFEYSGGLVGF